MSLTLARVTARRMQKNVPVYRYDALGVPVTLATRLHVLPFSSDVARKSSSGDRTGVTCNDDYLDTSETVLARGDVIDREGLLYIVGVPQVNLDIATTTEKVVELAYANARITISRSTYVVDPVTTLSSSSLGVLFTGIPASLKTFQQEFNTEDHEVKDEFLLAVPEVIEPQLNDIVEFEPYLDTDLKLRRNRYSIKLTEPDFNGTRRFRIGQTRNSTL